MPQYTIIHEGQPVTVTIEAGLPLSLAQHFERLIQTLKEGAPPDNVALVEALLAADKLKAQVARLEKKIAQMEKETVAAVYGKENAIWHRRKAVELLRAMEAEGVGEGTVWPEEIAKVLEEVDPDEDQLRARENRTGDTNHNMSVELEFMSPEEYDKLDEEFPDTPNEGDAP